MPVDILDSQQGILAVLETISGTYVAPAAAAYILTNNLKPAFNQADKKTLKLDSFVRPVSKAFSAKKHNKLNFSVPVSWPAAAPTTTANLLAVNPLMRSCGASAPVAITTPAAGIQYTELNDPAGVPSSSISYRRNRSTANHYERQLAGARGLQKFKWKAGEVPQFDFELYAMWKAQAQVAALAPTVGTQLTNIGQPSNATNTVNVLLNSKTLCAVEINDDNLWRMKAIITESLCGTGPMSEIVEESTIDVTFKMPDIATEFNPDLYWGNDYPFEFTIKGDGTLASRSMRFVWATVNAEKTDETAVDGWVYTKMSLTKLSPLLLQLF
jgi:hypothetical protein